MHLPDGILFADTGGEKPETYTFLGVMNEWCIANLDQEIIVVAHEKVTRYEIVASVTEHFHPRPTVFLAAP